MTGTVTIDVNGGLLMARGTSVSLCVTLSRSEGSGAGRFRHGNAALASPDSSSASGGLRMTGAATIDVNGGLLMA